MLIYTYTDELEASLRIQENYPRFEDRNWRDGIMNFSVMRWFIVMENVHNKGLKETICFLHIYLSVNNLNESGNKNTWNISDWPKLISVLIKVINMNIWNQKEKCISTF